MKKLRPILENLNIRQVVSLDDEYNKSLDDEIKTEEINYYTDELNLSTDESQFLYDSGYQIISELQEDSDIISQKIMQKIRISITETAATAETISSPLIWLENAINEIQSSTLRYEKISKPSDVSLVNVENTLWIIDKDIYGIDNIYNSISTINNKFGDFLNIFIVYTYDNKLCYLNDSWDSRFKYLRSIGFTKVEANNLAYQFFVFSKPERPQIPGKIELKKVIYNSVIGHTVYSVYCNIKEANKKVFFQFDGLTKKISFERLSTFRYNVENEGEHNIYKLLNNVLNLMELQQYNEFMKQDEHYVNAFKKIISNTNGQQENEESIERLATITLLNDEYLWNKYQSIDHDINLAYEDIQFGDVFDLELTDFYKNKFNVLNNQVIGIIITQSCDCIIRKDQNTRKDTMIKLLIFEEQSTIPTDKIKEIFTNGIFLYKNQNNTPYSFIMNNNYKGMLHLDDAILDLSTLNVDGKSIILKDEDLLKEIELRKPQIWNKKMYDNLKRDNFITNEIKDLSPALLKYFIETKYGIKYDTTSNKFNLKRIGRLTHNNAHTILNHYINSISRIGKESPTAIKLIDEQNN